MSKIEARTDGATKPVGDAGHMPQGVKFYIKVGVGNSDGTMDIDGESITASEELQNIVDACVAETEEHGIVYYVYECRAVRKVIRGKTKVVTLKS
jgi:hypothetical protein